MYLSLAALIVFGAGLAVGAGATALLMMVRGLHRQITELKERIAKLEEAGRKRMPFGAVDEILDGIAVLSRLDDDLELKRDYLHVGLAHIKKAIQTGTKGRE
jgi:hypothetical protein